MKKKKRKNSIYPLWATAPALLIYTVFAVVPILISLVFSFTDWNMERLYSPEFAGLKNYIGLMEDPVFLKSIANTFIFALCTTVLKTVVGFLLALALVRKVAARGVLRTIYYAPCVMSITVVGVLFKSILANTGLLNNALSLLGMDFLTRDWLAKYGTAMGSVIFVETWMWAGFNMFIFLSGLQAIPSDYYESATLDGANGWEKFRYVTLPLIVPSLTVVVTLSIAGGLKVFDIIYVITNGGPGFDTQVLSTYTYQTFSLGFLGESTAGSVILAVIVTIISFVMNRYFTKREVEM
ncbi:MAG TPA: sugar ABC transporter permease [Candidatus Mediterraneibacter surreyensis]|nr:sugar ABC transporter permease [Candidatus Mediterraneibacter surreyensis]